MKRRLPLAAVPLLVALAVVLPICLYRNNDDRGGRNSQSETATNASTGDSVRSVSVSPHVSSSVRSSVAATGIRLSDVTEQSGIHFEYYGNPSPQHYMTEHNGGGVSLVDYDGDGRLDVFFVNGSHFQQPAHEAGASNRLFRQNGKWQFNDVTTAAGLQAFGCGMGCTAGDYNNDGFPDLYVTYYGRNRLWHNNGDGTYDDVTEAAAVGDESWGTSTAFCDLDGDGNLDLYVVNFVDWSPTEPPCHSNSTPSVPVVCAPNNRSGQSDVLYHNQGSGRFVNVAAEAGVAIADEGKGLAVSIADLDDDRRPDIYVANDTTRNFLFRNEGGMRFREIGVPRGVAYSDTGKLGAGMGIGCADYNGDGRLDLCVSNFRHEVNDVFANLGERGFVATNAELGVDRVSRMMLTWGILFADFDLDGWPDMFMSNGHIWDLSSVTDDSQYRMRPNLLQNLRGERFIDVSDDAGEYFATERLGRAVAAGDLDNDGDTDLVVTEMIDRATVLRNDSQLKGRVLRVRLIGRFNARQAFGTRLEARVGAERIVACVPAGQSFQAGHDDRLCLAVGNAVVVDELRVFWPNEHVEVWRNLPIDTELRLQEGTGSLQGRQ